MIRCPPRPTLFPPSWRCKHRQNGNVACLESPFRGTRCIPWPQQCYEAAGMQAPVSCRRSQFLDLLAAEYTDNTESCSVIESIPWYSVYSVASALYEAAGVKCRGPHRPSLVLHQVPANVSTA